MPENAGLAPLTSAQLQALVASTLKTGDAVT
jgi:hypothetical protein